MHLPSLSPALPQLVVYTYKALDGSPGIALSEWDSPTLVHSTPQMFQGK